jgi:plastocyanin
MTGYYGYISFNPSSVTISVGGKVTWQNSSSSSIALSSSQAGISTTIPSGGNFPFTFNMPGSYSVSAQTGSLGGSMTVTVVAAGAQPEEVQEFSLIHSLKDLKIYPATLTVKKGIKVRLFNTATDGSHPTVAISSDEDGKNPVFGVQPFDVEVGKLTVVEFTPDKEGTYFITHHLHGHNILGKLIVTGGP